MFFGGPPDIERLKASKNIGGLIKALSNRDQSVVSKAAAALADLGDPAAVEPLIAVFDKKQGPLLPIVKALGSFVRDSRTLRPLVTAATLNQAVDVREAAADSLAKLDKMELVQEDIATSLEVMHRNLFVIPLFAAGQGWDALDVTMSRLKDESGFRVTGLALLDRLCGAEAARSLTSSFQRDSRTAYRRTAHTLAEVIDGSAVGRLNAALQDSDEDVRDFAAMVLLELQNPLAAKLVSNDEGMFLEGLREAVAAAEAGRREGIEAMREAIRVRSGKPEVTFYEAGVVSTVGSERYDEPQLDILALAAGGALLEDPHHAGDLLSAVMFSSSEAGLGELVEDVFALGGPDQGYALQLLYHELRSTARSNLGETQGQVEP